MKYWLHLLHSACGVTLAEVLELKTTKTFYNVSGGGVAKNQI